MFHPKIGLALGGGGPKGLAHIGVIKVLEKNNIPIDFIAGTSVGAMVGGMYAYSKNITSLESHFLDKNWLQMLSYFADPSLKGGLIQGNKMEKFLQEYVQSATFKDLKIPFKATAVSLQTGQFFELNKGSLSTAIRASCAVPMLFKPVEIDGELFADGGLFSSVPVQTVKKMGADIIIAVQLNKHLDSKQNVQHLNIMEVGELALQIVERKIADDEVSRADITICPQLARVHWKDFIKQDARENGMLLGEEAAHGSVAQIKIRVAENNVSRTINRWILKIKGLFSVAQ